MYGAVGCPDWRFCGIIMYSNTLRLAVYCKIQDLQLPAETVYQRIFTCSTQFQAQTSKHLQINIPYLKMELIPQRKQTVLYYKNETVNAIQPLSVKTSTREKLNLSLSLSLSLSHTHTHTQTLSLSLSLTHTHNEFTSA